MSSELVPRIISVISHTQHIPAETISADSTFEQLNIDSLDGINILFALENEFNINIPDEAAQGLKSVRDIATGIAKLLEGNTAGATAAG